jgi:choline-sulfatase
MPKQPNIIVCMCDQLRSFEVGCYGNDVIRTPNIDKLASEGVRFETMCSNNPVCTPARSILLTGQYSRTATGTVTNVAETPPNSQRERLTSTTLPEALKREGYQTALIGKWHVDPHPNLVGFDYTVFPHHSHRNTGQTYFENSDEPRVVEGFAPDYEADEVKKYVQEHKETPFFLFYNISPPHMPVADGPDAYTKMYSPDEVPLRDNVFIDGEMPYDEHWFKIYLHDYLYYLLHLPYTEELPEGFDLRDLVALYYGMTTCVDDQVGKLMTLLEEEGIAEDTLVVFLSDHGDILGSHHLFNKDRLIEEAIRVPLIYHWPVALEPSEVTEQIGCMVDLMPTVLDLVDVSVPSSVQGTNLGAVVRGEETTTGENVAYLETAHHEIGIRTDRYTYGIQLTNGKTEPSARMIADDRYQFFDRETDPLQQNNLAKTDEQANVAAELRERVLAWHKTTPWAVLD